MKDSSGGGGSGAANLRKKDLRSKVGVESKTTSSNALRSKKHLAWYVAYYENPLEKKLSRVPQIKWRCPPKLVLDPGWQVACGEESSEVDTQKYRETTVIEAVYSHLSAIPPSPSICPDMEVKHDDDGQIPLIPIVPIEEAGAIEMPFDTSAPVETFNCPSTSGSLDLTLSRFNSSLSPNPPTSEKSLLDVLHGLAGSDLTVAATVAAAMESKREIDTELLIKFLSGPEMMKTLVNKTGIGANSEPRVPPGPKSATYPLSSNSTEPGNIIFTPVAMNQPITIKESVSDLGVTPAKLQSIPIKESASDLAVTPKPQPIPIKESVSHLGVTPAKLQPIPIKESASDLGVTPPKHQPIPIKESASDLSVPPPKLQPIPIRESASDLSVTPPKRQPIPIKESASDLGVPPAKHARICTPNVVKIWSPAPLRSDSHPPLIPDLTNGAREPGIARSIIHGNTGTNERRPLTVPTLSYNENQYVRMINQYGVPNAAPMLPLYPSFSKPNLEAASKPMFKQHPPGAPPSFTGIKPVSFPPPFSSTSRPYVHCMTDGYRALDHAGLKPCLGSNPPMPFALGLNAASSSTFHPCPYPYMNKSPSPVEDVNFCKSLTNPHGEKRIRNEYKLPNYGQPFNNLHEQHTNPSQINPTFQKPCMFFNSSKGCRKGSNCRYMHIKS